MLYDGRCLLVIGRSIAITTVGICIVLISFIGANEKKGFSKYNVEPSGKKHYEPFTWAFHSLDNEL